MEAFIKADRYQLLEGLKGLLQSELVRSFPKMHWIKIQRRANDSLANEVWDRVERELSYCLTQKILIVTLISQKYPPGLWDLYDPPLVLFLKGSFQKLQEGGIAIVGSRDPTIYGVMLTRNLIHYLKSTSEYTVSGGARGIDSVVHRSSISANIPNVCVLGGGLKWAVKLSGGLYYDLMGSTQTLLLSEFTHDTVPSKYSFPQRNRIISGLAKKITVMEAAAKSGALITAEFGTDLNRRVYAFPGPIDSQNSYGTNRLIFNGATPIFDIKQFVEGFKLNANPT